MSAAFLIDPRPTILGADRISGEDLANILRGASWVLVGVAVMIFAIGFIRAVQHSRQVTSHITSKLVSIDLAVNNVAPDEPPLIAQVRSIVATLNRVCDHLNIPPHE